MAIDVTIKQKLFGNKTLPLDVILGPELHYGNFENDRLIKGEHGTYEFIAYHPEHIGRGFSVVWNPNEKKKIDLRLPMPSTIKELKDFYDSVERIMKYWNGKLVVDGNVVTLTQFLDGLEDMISFNDKTIKEFSSSVLNGEHESLLLYSAFWPLSMGKEEAERFHFNIHEYAVWLHEMQMIDAEYAPVAFYQASDAIVGRYTIQNQTSYLIPLQPDVPLGVIDPNTGEELHCKNWGVFLGIEGQDEPLSEIEYQEFLSRIPKSKIKVYDARLIQVMELTETEIRKLCE